SGSPYAQFLQQHRLSWEERVVLLLALAPHVCPWVLDPFLVKNQSSQRGFTEFGGLKGVYHSGFLPTGETAAFLVAAENLTRRFTVQNLLQADHFFARQNILRLEKDKTDEPFLSGALVISKEYLNYFTSGKPYRPSFSSEFPAQLLQTNLEWEDLVLEDEILDDLEEILAWLQHGDVILHDMGLKKQLKPGFRSLFYGPPGTGKTLAVSLLGKTTGRDVYRIDISKVVSKYIGETEKNLANIFDQAENKNWILFFDEADAIFGKRTATKDAKDRYANQEVAYLLQRIEEYAGLVILATNLKANID
ncbi:MAG TPA: ATP-binding protein, partial [Saprospiraceae bacterium]|nr:ATP-binding protein [Saprospiraceae bacterium]